MMKKLLAIIIYCILFPILLFVISPIFVPKWNMWWDNYIGNLFRGFYAEKENSIEVLFMGNSDMYRGIIPIELYDNYGISSYLYASPGQRMWTGYYMLLDALRYQHPKVIIYGIDSMGSPTDMDDENIRKTFDHMEFSSVKLKAIFSKDAFNFDFGEKISLIFPIFRYHYRINDLTKEDFILAYGKHSWAYKGYDLIKKIDGHNDGNSYMEDEDIEYEISDKVLKYLDLFVEKCKEENIELILTEIPSSESWEFAKSKAMSEYAKEKKVKFLDLNLLNDEIGIDWTTDTADQGDHLNYYGAKKVTSYVGKYLKENYDLKDIRPNILWEKYSKIFHHDEQTTMYWQFYD